MKRKTDLRIIKTNKILYELWTLLIKFRIDNKFKTNWIKTKVKKLIIYYFLKKKVGVN